LFALLGGALFGPVWGSALNLAGATVGATAAFLVARYLAGDWATQKSAGILKQLLGGVEAEGWRFVAFVRLVPLFPFNLTNYALGLTRIGFLPYALTSLVCMAPGAIAYTWLGYAGREALGGNASAVRYGLLGLGLLAAIAFVPRLVKRIRQRPVGWMDAEELQQQLRSGAALRVIDVRGADEFSGPLGHILGALNVPLDELEGRTKELRARAAGGIAVVCRTDRRSAVAQRSLHAAGFTNVAVLRGGMERWHALGFETSGGSPWPPAKQEESHA
jgi:rhodanese-related sulfurtransferase/membrane protein DedA with SNARE-associated domain